MTYLAITWLWTALAIVALVSLTLVCMGIIGYAVRRMNPGEIIPPSEDDRPIDAAPGTRPPVDERDGWQVAGVAPDQLTAEIWVDVIQNAGIPARISASDTASYMGVSAMACRVLVPAESIEEARAAIATVQS